MDSQNVNILRLLKTRPRGITAIDAMTTLNCWRLAARVHELRASGYEIETHMEEHDGGQHARYLLRIGKKY